MTPCSIHLTRRQPACNMARFYRLEITPDLFGGAMLIRNRGRIGGVGQLRRQWFHDVANADAELRLWINRKSARGYLRQP